MNYIITIEAYVYVYVKIKIQHCATSAKALESAFVNTYSIFCNRGFKWQATRNADMLNICSVFFAR